MAFSHTSTTKILRLLLLIIGVGSLATITIGAVAYVKAATLSAQNVTDSASTTAHTTIIPNVPNTSAIPNTTVIDKVFVNKSARILQLLSNDTIIKTYHIALGDSPTGHKQQQGDERTPTGVYTLDYKNENSKFYRSIHISYPNAADKAHAKKKGVSAGGDIMIHGQTNGFGHLAAITQQRDWTDGCIAVSNDEMDEIMHMVKIGVSIEIVE